MLPKNVKYLRKKEGYTLRALAEKCNISIDLMYKYIEKIYRLENTYE